MGFKDSFRQKSAEVFFDKNKDRITQVQGKVLSIKVEEKTFLWIIHKLTAIILIKPENSKNVVQCVYKKRRWFKQVNFMTIFQGHSLIVQGLKSHVSKKDTREIVEILNIRNNTTKKFLVPVEGAENLKVQRVRPNKKIR
ncbi:hypothetical protein [Hathewaya limosa]|uniref:Mevalonate kinase n=1 Tax=Hathewaya limosa TaxID=1536 RepID=A0ABU0JUW3_HATLI|nr:hypothetical protein [Hathewaya limosa]AWZ48220.1 hypothetical protein C3495_05045 [Clostridiaceae bacterium 14S0207]MDQ0480889.1 mevalonate kinase [Hathewaya limosa]